MGLRISHHKKKNICVTLTHQNDNQNSKATLAYLAKRPMPKANSQHNHWGKSINNP